MQYKELMYGVLNYEMDKMSFDHGQRLFSRHGFKRDTPLDDYHILARDVVSITGLLPLALEALGSFLYLEGDTKRGKTNQIKLHRISQESSRRVMMLSQRVT